MNEYTAFDASANELRLLCVLAHPDDESLGFGGILARYAAEGVATYVLTATTGERGWQGAPEDDPGPAALAAIRAMELRDAANVLGVRGLNLLDYGDGQLAEADRDEVIAVVTSYIRQVQPHVVLSFGPEGATGHPDHIAISQITAAAIVCAADAGYEPARHYAPHRVSKLYYLAETRERLDIYDSVFGDSAMTVDGVVRRVSGWPHWAITTRVDVQEYTQQVWQAIRCHRSQVGYALLEQLPEAQHHLLWDVQEFYRAWSLVNGGRSDEDDLFAGLREQLHLEGNLL